MDKQKRIAHSDISDKKKLEQINKLRIEVNTEASEYLDYYSVRLHQVGD